LEVELLLEYQKGCHGAENVVLVHSVQLEPVVGMKKNQGQSSDANDGTQ
jgi:hypothetical protein